MGRFVEDRHVTWYCRRMARIPSPPEDELRALFHLLDDDPTAFTLSQWRQRNLQIWNELDRRGLVDTSLVSASVVAFLDDTLITDQNPAAVDPQNAGHIRAQNENILHFALSAGFEREALTVALAAGFIHDLNKAVGEPLREDDFAVRDGSGAVVPTQSTLAVSVGLNHLGERTRQAIEDACGLAEGALSPEVAREIDLCIIHHGLGSSRFIRDLLDGNNEWWGEEFAVAATGEKKLLHPCQPGLTRVSVLHDLADSSQQMQGGVAWLEKYPFGFWKDASNSVWEMISGAGDRHEGGIPRSLRRQIEVETETCREIVRTARAQGLVSDEEARKLEATIVTVTRSCRAWFEDDPEYLAAEDGKSVYHDVAHDLGITPAAAVERLKQSAPDDPQVRELLHRSARAVDVDRTEDLAALIAGHPAI